jgi:hypothetical protein
LHEFIIHITVAEHGRDWENGERWLDGFMEAHPETGPSVSQDIETGTLSVTFGIEADDAENAFDVARPIFGSGAAASGLDPSEILNIEVSLVQPDECEAPDLREPIPA